MFITKRYSSAFTLVELVVVISVIAILAVITTLGITRYTATARDQARNSSVISLSEALEKYYDQNGEYPGCPQLTGSSSNVAQLLGVSADALKLPETKTDNAVQCTDSLASSNTDTIVYVGDGSTTCATSNSCLQFTLKYKKEVDGGIVSIDSRRKVNITTSGNTTLTANSAGQTTINLSWTAIPNAVSYAIQRSTDNTFPGGGSTVASSATGTTSSQTGLKPGTTYYFRLQSVGSTGTGDWTNAVSAATDPIPVPNVTAVAQNSGRSALVVTMSSSTGATTYTVQRALDSGFSSGVVVLGTSGTTSYTDTGASIGTTYYYRAKATNTGNGGDSGWGNARSGSIGWICSDKNYIGTYPSCSLPVQLLNSDTYQKCATANNQGDSQLYCWGVARDASSNAVLNSSTPKLMNTSAKGTNTITSVALSQRLCYTAGGGLYCADDAGATPTRVTALSQYNVTKIALTGSYFSNGGDTRYQCAVASGSLYCWGWNGWGQVGNGTTTDVATPTKVGGPLAGKTVTDVSVDLQTTCAVADGQLYCWGADVRNPISNFSRDYPLSSTPILASGLSGYTATSVDLTNQNVCVTTTASKVFCYGNGENNYNASNGLRFGSDSAPTIQTSMTIVPMTQGVLPTTNATAVGGGPWNRCTLVTNGQVYCWGDGSGGTNGNGSTASTGSPVQVTSSGVLSGKTITDVKGTCLIADGQVYCWGLGGYGALGNGGQSNSSVPVKANIPAPAF